MAAAVVAHQTRVEPSRIQEQERQPKVLMVVLPLSLIKEEAAAALPKKVETLVRMQARAVTVLTFLHLLAVHYSQSPAVAAVAPLPAAVALAVSAAAAQDQTMGRVVITELQTPEVVRVAAVQRLETTAVAES